MKLSRIAFRREVPSPASDSMEPSHWARLFAAPHFAIERDGDAVRITSTSTGRRLIYPWSTVAAGEPESLLAAPVARIEPAVVSSRQAPAPEPLEPTGGNKRGKR